MYKWSLGLISLCISISSFGGISQPPPSQINNYVCGESKLIDGTWMVNSSTCVKGDKYDLSLGSPSIWTGNKVEAVYVPNSQFMTGYVYSGNSEGNSPEL